MTGVVLKKSLIVLPSLMLLAAASSMAMSLGRHSGATLVGRPLDLSVQAVLDGQDDVGSLCVDADVFYGDTKLDKSRVSVTLEKSASSPSQALIRIRSSALVDEPVVTLYVRAGCQLKTERRYVTLAELVSEVAPDRATPMPMPLPSVAPAAVPFRSAVVPSPNPSTSGAQSAAPQPARSARRGGSPATPAFAQADPGNITPGAAAPAAKPLRQRAAGQASRAPAPSKARLKLEPLDLLIERDPQLKASSELLSTPAANPQDRAAASALWRALSAQPEDILRDAEKLQSLEASVGGLQDQRKKNLSSISDLNGKLQQAEAERYDNVLVYALAGLLLLALAGLAFLMRERVLGRYGGSGDKPWWGKNQAFENQQEAWLDSGQAQVPLDPGAKSPGSLSKSEPQGMEIDFDLDQVSPEPAAVKPAAVPRFVDSANLEPKNSLGFGPSVLPARAVKAEELFDVQQQADFFVSIGQNEQAIEVLRNHIAENPDTSALVYLDLFNLYHQLNRPAEYDGLRLDFNQRFNTRVPNFDLYTDQGVGLESYQRALSRIEALWPSPKVLDVIEESLFRHPDTTEEAFNLAAYRELLLLYSVAKDVIGRDARTDAASRKFDLPERPAGSVRSKPATFSPTSIQPLSASIASTQQTAENMAAASVSMGLDIDLGELSGLDEKSNPVADSDAQFFAQFDSEATVSMKRADAESDAESVPAAAAPADIYDLVDFDLLEVPKAEPAKPKLSGD